MDDEGMSTTVGVAGEGVVVRNDAPQVEERESDSCFERVYRAGGGNESRLELEEDASGLWLLGDYLTITTAGTARRYGKVLLNVDELEWLGRVIPKALAHARAARGK